MIPLFDLHCDTLLEAYNLGSSLEHNILHISLEKSSVFSPYFQVTSIWSDNNLTDDEAFFKTTKVINHYKSNGIVFLTNVKAQANGGFILGIEDARLLNNSINRLEQLHKLGTRILTLNWKNTSCVGGGFNTDEGLTDFGIDIVKKCAKLGIIVDLSHSSSKVFNDVINLAARLGFSPIASHSNSFSVCNHKRNLTDEQLRSLISLNSVVGISLVNEHVNLNGATKYDLIQHASHILSLGGENLLCLGCDFDGCTNLVQGIYGIEDLEALFSFFTQEFGYKIAKKIFFENAYNFFSINLKGG